MRVLDKLHSILYHHFVFIFSHPLIWLQVAKGEAPAGANLVYREKSVSFYGALFSINVVDCYQTLISIQKRLCL